MNNGVREPEKIQLGEIALFVPDQPSTGGDETRGRCLQATRENRHPSGHINKVGRLEITTGSSGWYVQYKVASTDYEEGGHGDFVTSYMAGCMPYQDARALWEYMIGHWQEEMGEGDTFTHSIHVSELARMEFAHPDTLSASYIQKKGEGFWEGVYEERGEDEDGDENGEEDQDEAA